MQKIEVQHSDRLAIVDDNVVIDERVYLRSDGKSLAIKGQTLPVFLYGNAPEGLQWDHADGDIFNNLRENLRFATHSQQQMNRGKFKTGSYTSRFKGVYFQGRWVARIRVNGKRIYLGRFDTEEEAAEAYNLAAMEHHGEFAVLNVLTQPRNYARLENGS